MVDIEVGWAHLVPGGLRELDEHLGRAARVDDLEVAADAPEQACGTPNIQGVATSVEHYIPLIHGVCFLVASLLREDRKEEGQGIAALTLVRATRPLCGANL